MGQRTEGWFLWVGRRGDGRQGWLKFHLGGMDGSGPPLGSMGPEDIAAVLQS
jgi:hypothetical protein